jgi:drug/metabolite transporter (DMT)-like permease
VDKAITQQQVLDEKTYRVKTPFSDPRSKGFIVMGVVLLIWSGFSLTIKSIGASPLATADVALIRFIIPLLLLLPLIPSRLVKIKQAGMTNVVIIQLGGVPFIYLAALGGQTAPAAYMGTILAGTPPLFVALLIALIYRQTIAKKRFIALLMIMAGVITLIVGQSGTLPPDILQGVTFLLAGSFVWASYTVGLKRAGLDPITVAIILSSVSSIVTITLIASGTVESNLGSFGLQETLPFILVQGLGVGIIATIGYSYAVSQLGSSRAAIMGSISPALTALLAIPSFGESLTSTVILGISFTSAGVILASRG